MHKFIYLVIKLNSEKRRQTRFLAFAGQLQHGHTALDFVYILEKRVQMSNLQLTQEKL